MLFTPPAPPPPISMLAPAFQEQDLFVWFPWVARIVVNIEIGGRGGGWGTSVWYPKSVAIIIPSTVEGVSFALHF